MAITRLLSDSTTYLQTNAAFNAALNATNAVITQDNATLSSVINSADAALNSSISTINSALNATNTTVSQNYTSLNSSISTINSSIAALQPVTTVPTTVNVFIGSTNQYPSEETGSPTVTLKQYLGYAHLSISITARDKSAPTAGFTDADTLRITGLPIYADDDVFQNLWIEPGPDTGFTSDTYALLIGDTIGFYKPGRIALKATDIADNYSIRLSGWVSTQI